MKLPSESDFDKALEIAMGKQSGNSCFIMCPKSLRRKIKIQAFADKALALIGIKRKRIIKKWNGIKIEDEK